MFAHYLWGPYGGFGWALKEWTAFSSFSWPLQAAIVLLLLVALLWLVMKLTGLLVATLRFLNGDETAISRYFDRNRERKGYQALSDGLMALASGEGRVALSRAAKADKLLDRPELTTLLILKQD